jgi:hypothetical protein
MLKGISLLGLMVQTTSARPSGQVNISGTPRQEKNSRGGTGNPMDRLILLSNDDR